VIKDAKELKGYFTLWQKDEHTWLEIREDQLDKPFFFGNSLASGLGERFFLPGLMGDAQVVSFQRFGNNLQMVAQNLLVRAPAGTPLALAVRESYSDSLLASTTVVSTLHAERKSFLVDAAALLGGDLLGVQTALEAAYRLPYSLDRGNSHIERARANEQGTYVTFRSHFSVPKLPAPPVQIPGAPPPPPGSQPNPPRIVPDPRSLFLSVAYSLAPLPEQPMHARNADQRVGHFTTSYFDLGSGLADVRTHLVERWRLEKKDPAADVSDAKDPVVVWMDRNIPEAYRAAVRAGILEWNKAFERAGIRNALDVRQQAADADWTTVEGTRHIAVRWFAMQGPGAVAVGPSQSDPRTGEILRAAAIIPENWVRIGRTQVGEILPKAPAAEQGADALADGHTCTYASDALEQASFAFELLVERGELDPNGADATRFIEQSLKDVTMHEVGHALGLRHNFKASTGLSPEQLRDVNFVNVHGVSNSVMDYNDLNIPLENEPASVYEMPTLGEYDYWAIEYAYRELPADKENDELAKIANRAAANPNLAYGTDEDAAGSLSIDPLANLFDLSNDPLAYYQRRFKLARELWSRTQTRELAPGDNFSIYRRNLVRGLTQMQRLAPLIAKYVGGVFTSRDVVGGSGAALYTPVPAEQQKQALDVLAREILSDSSFRFDPKFMSRLGVDHLDRPYANDLAQAINTDFSLAASVLAIQRGVLDQLMSDGIAARLANAEDKVADRKQLLTLADVQARLMAAIWSEVTTGGEVDSMRRNLQREHARRLAAGVLRPTSAVAADVSAVNRQIVHKLDADLRRALASGRGSATTRAHYAEMETMLSEALKAPLIKQGA